MRVDELARSRKIPTRELLPLFFALFPREQGHAVVVNALLSVDGIDANYALASKQRCDVTRVGIFLDFVRRSGTTGTRAGGPHAGPQHVPGAKRNRIDHSRPHGFFFRPLLQAKTGDTALLLAAQNGNIEVINALLAVDGINVNAGPKDGTTALLLYASWAVQFHPDGGQIGFAWLPTRVSHVGPQHVW